jgi:hypothetical protein
LFAHGAKGFVALELELSVRGDLEGRRHGSVWSDQGVLSEGLHVPVDEGERKAIHV